jgi:hypothetical protein
MGAGQSLLHPWCDCSRCSALRVKIHHLPMRDLRRRRPCKKPLVKIHQPRSARPQELHASSNASERRRFCDLS